MADAEHLRILREGVDRWNQWRKATSELKPDLSRVKLSRLKLIGADFSRTGGTAARGLECSSERTQTKQLLPMNRLRGKQIFSFRL
jgi:hypothetical protein